MVQRVATLMGCGRERCSLRDREDRGKCQNGRSRAGEESISSSLSERPRRTPNPQATGIWQLSSRSCLAEQPRNDTGVGRQGRWGWGSTETHRGPTLVRCLFVAGNLRSIDTALTRKRSTSGAEAVEFFVFFWHFFSAADSSLFISPASTGRPLPARFDPDPDVATGTQQHNAGDSRATATDTCGRHPSSIHPRPSRLVSCGRCKCKRRYAYAVRGSSACTFIH